MIRDLFRPVDLMALAFFAGVVLGLVSGFALGAAYTGRTHTVAVEAVRERAAEDRATLAVTVATCEQWRWRVGAYDEAAIGPLAEAAAQRSGAE